MQPQKHQRRSPEQWHSIIEQQLESGLSAPQFCKEQNIGYASFCVWKRRIQSEHSGASVESTRAKPAQFIDLSSLSHSDTAGWRITLRLGNGVELELSQA